MLAKPNEWTLRGIAGAKKPLKMAVFLGITLFSAGFVISSYKVPPSGEKGVLGGPAVASAAYSGDTISGGAVFGTQSIVLGGSYPDSLSLRTVVPGENGVLAIIADPGEPIGPVYSRDNLIAYKVQKGDTLSGIAAYFGVSLDTIVNANPTVRAQFLRPGDTLNILPTSGVVYQTKGGDTLESIADYFNIPTDKITQFNKSVNFGTLGAGVSIVIPGGKAGLASSRSSLPNFNGNFIKPADGFNWGILHHYNAVDIANSCGISVVASAEGLVVPDETYGDGHGGWSGGYGQFVLIEHPFGDSVRTRYAHLEKILVNIGDYVQQGQEIGIMGDTGDATGCHVHFEVYDAENPFTK